MNHKFDLGTGLDFHSMMLDEHWRARHPLSLYQLLQKLKESK